MQSRPQICSIGDHIQQALNVVHPIVSKFTYPLFAVDSRDRPDLFASSVLLKIDDKLLLLTAAHAIYEILQAGSSVHVGAKTISPLSSSFIKTSTNGRDELDLAGIVIAEEFRVEQSMLALPMKGIEHEDFLSQPHMRCIHGYPISKNKTAKRADESRKVFTKYGFTYAGASHNLDVDYARYKKDRQKHIAIKYQKRSRNDSGEQVTPPHPKGISGGGMWSVPDSFNPQTVFLEGIAIEYHGNALAFATRIECAIAFIRKSVLQTA